VKKAIIYITTILLLTIITVGGTYAFFTANASSKNDVVTEAHKFEVIYTGGTKISGPLNLASKKEQGTNTTVNIKVAEDSVLGKANIYIMIEEISKVIANDALVWEVYKTSQGVESFVDSGTFLECADGNNTKPCEANDKLYLVKNYKLSKENTSFTIYLWLNGNLVDNQVIGATFKGYIGAESENFTADIE